MVAAAVALRGEKVVPTSFSIPDDLAPFVLRGGMQFTTTDDGDTVFVVKHLRGDGYVDAIELDCPRGIITPIGLGQIEKTLDRCSNPANRFEDT